MSEQRDALAARVMAALNEHGRSYRLPRDPSDLAYSVADAILATEGDAAPGGTAEQMRLRAEAAEAALGDYLTALDRLMDMHDTDHTVDGYEAAHDRLVTFARAALQENPDAREG